MINLSQDVAEMFAACQAAPEMEEGYGVIGDVRDMEASPGVAWLRSQGEDYNDHGDTLARASDTAREVMSDSNRKYRNTPKGREARRRYSTSPKGLAAKKRYRERKARGEVKT